MNGLAYDTLPIYLSDGRSDGGDADSVDDIFADVDAALLQREQAEGKASPGTERVPDSPVMFSDSGSEVDMNTRTASPESHANGGPPAPPLPSPLPPQPLQQKKTQTSAGTEAPSTLLQRARACLFGDDGEEGEEGCTASCQVPFPECLDRQTDDVRASLCSCCACCAWLLCGVDIMSLCCFCRHRRARAFMCCLCECICVPRSRQLGNKRFFSRGWATLWWTLAFVFMVIAASHDVVCLFMVVPLTLAVLPLLFGTTLATLNSGRSSLGSEGTEAERQKRVFVDCGQAVVAVLALAIPFTRFRRGDINTVVLSVAILQWACFYIGLLGVYAALTPTGDDDDEEDIDM